MITPEGQLLDEAGALSLWNRRNELPPNERPWAEQQLRNYAGDRKAKNEHLWPSQEAQKAKANERMEARWLDGAETPGATPEAKDLYNEMAALSMFSGATGEQISYALPKYRSAVANALGSPGAETDPKQFRELLQVAIKTKRDKRVLIEGDPKTDPKRENSMGQHAWAAARDQVSEIDAYAKWSEKAKDKPGFDAQDNFDIFSKLQSAAKVKWDDYRSRAQMITSVLTDEMRQDTPSINVDGLLPLLSGLTAEERGSVLSLVKEDAMAKEKEVGQKTGETLARVGMRLGTAFTEMTDRGVANLSKFESGQWANVSSANDPQKLVEDQRARLYGAMTASMFGRPPALFEDQQQVQLTAEQAAAANKEVGKVKEQFRIVRELRDVATGKVDPAGSSNKAVDLLYYGSLNFVASMATFAIPGGMALNYNAYVNDEVNRLESLGVPSSEAMNQAMLVGAVQSGLDKFELSIFKRLPGLKNFKESMKAPPTDLAKALIGRVAGATAISVGESLAEGGQQMTPMVVQNMAAAIDKDRKTAEVRGLLKEGWTATYETFVSMLPLALMGLGIGGYGDFKGIQKLVSDKSALSKVGFSSEQISNIVAQPTPKGQAEFMASIWRERTPVHTAAITETQQKANDILQNPASTPGQISWAARASAGIEDHRVTEAAIFDALKEDAGGEDVSVVREKDGYLVNGKPAATANDAMGLLSAMAEERTQQWYSAVDEMVNKMVIGRTIEIKKGKSTLLDEILAAEEEGSDRKIETIWNRAQIAAAAAGMPAIERDIENPATIETLNNLRVLGKSITEVKGNVLSSVSRILAGGGIIDLVEENAENDLRESILSGEVSMSAMKTALGKVEAATGIKFMENATDLGITEGWSKLVRLYVTGTKKEKTGFAAQAVRGDVAFKMKRIKQLMREESGKGTIDESLVSKLSAHMAYFKEILRNVRLVMKARESGALDDVESMIRKSIGLEDASIAEKTVAEIMVAQVESVTGESMSVSPSIDIDAEYQRIMDGVKDLASIAVENVRTGKDGVKRGRSYSPKIRELLNRRDAGEKIPFYVFDKAVKEHFPSYRVPVPKSMTELPTREQVLDAVTIDKKEAHDATLKLGGPKEGDDAILRQDVPAQTDAGIGVVTLKTENGNLYLPAARARNPKMVSNEKQTVKIGKGGRKAPHIVIKATYMADQSMPEDLENWTQVGFNPDRHSFYYERGTERQVVSGSEIFQIGNTAFIKDAVFKDQKSDISYSVSPFVGIDAEYMAAVESGDVAKQQEMVDAAAQAAGLIKANHTSPSKDIKVFNRRYRSEVLDMPNLVDESVIWFREGEGAARYGTTQYNVFLSLKDPWVAEGKLRGGENGWNRFAGMVETIAEDGNPETFVSHMKKQGWDGVKIVNVDLDLDKFTVYGVFDSNQIKSAEPVTYDNQGNVIPLSQRFNQASDDISYSVSSLAGLDELINRIDERMASNIPAQNALWSKSAKILRDMERDLKTTRVTPDRYDDKGKLIPGRVIPALVEKRSASNIAKEAAFRAATDYDIRTPQELDAEQIVRRNAIFTKQPISKLKEDRAAYRTAVFEETFKGEASADETAWNHFQAVKDSILARSNISTEDAAYILGEPASEGAKALLSNIRSALKEANAKSKQLYDSSLATQKKKYEAAAKEAQDWRDAEEVKHRGPKNEALAWKKGTIALQKIQYSPMAQLLRDVRVMQAAIATLPKEVRGMLSSVYNVAILSSPAARQVKILDELEKANKEIERFLLKKFQKDIKGIFEAAEEKKKSSGVITGTMTPDVQAYFTRAKTYAKMSREDVDKTMTALSDQLNQTNSTLESNEENTEKFIELMVFGAILGTGKNKPTAAEVYSAYEQLAFARKKGITAYAIKKTSIVEKISGMVASAIESLGKATLADAQEREARDKRQIRVLPGGVSELLRIYNIHDTLEVMFGENHPITKYFSAKIRHSRENARLEQYRETESLHNFIAENHGISSAGRQAIWLGKLSKPVKSPLKQGEGRKVTVDIIPLQAARNILDGTLKDSRYPGGSQAFSELRDMVDSAEEDQESITVEKVTFTGMRNLEISELEVVFYTMIWQQQRYKSNMENHGLGANFIAQAEEWLSPEAKSIREYLRFKYSQEYDGMNAVYRNLFNVNMPQEDNYARASFDASGNTDLAVGPDGIPVMTGGSTVASIKGRVKHNAEPKRANALTMRLSHVGMISHWKATAELSRDMRSVFENKDVRNSIIKKFGKQRYATLMVAVGTLEAGGWKHAVGNTEGGEFIQKMMPIAVANGLGANIGSIMAQGSAVLASSARIGATSYFNNLAKLAANPSVLVDVYKDFALQLRRGGQYSQGELLTMLTGENANVVAQTVMRVGEMATEALSVVDASLTTISGAVAYLHHLDTVKGTMGSEAAEKEYALDRMREVIEATAQPDDFARKSNFENKIARERGASAIALRTLFFFKSAQRGMAANIFKTAEQIRDGHITAKQGADRLAAMLIIIPLIEQACRSAWKDLTSDEPDEKLWEDPTTWIMAILSAPVSGVPVIGIGFDFLKVQTIGGYTSTLQDPISRLFFEFPKSVKKMANGELDMQDLIGALHFVTLGTIISGKTGGALAESAVNLLSAWVGWDDGSVLTDGQKGEKYLKMMDDKRRRKDKKALRESRD
ncbi:hypothetical protein UFOVP296_37 [uncultured Caudovirales phage]|uniref:Uncharacterized protein n=1 Tax=uncultured Caudovirales phage TaxID=2100421 RepID=A0A6J5LPZ4_9CAUD|nr:hypothetical protein UFOVP296_37 [uncultured Caudovirales phage]CAB4169868.1 hypothetical protein UFOVP912_12 [uncultured Caudovirales phage]CAB4199477.1 hypothetical protein UFOVP1334_44 [uncultured Caudovirales phage]